MSSVAPVPEVLQHLFLATNARIGQTWLLSTHIPFTELAPHHQALTLKIPLVAKAREAYGDLRTSSQMDNVRGWYWKPKPDLSTSIQKHSKLLNPQTVPTPMACLISLSSKSSWWDSLGDATIHTHWDKNGALYNDSCSSSLGHSRQWTRPTHQGHHCWISGMIRCSHHLVSQLSTTHTALSWQHPKVYLAKLKSLVSWTLCKTFNAFSFLIGSKLLPLSN
jgi:hypothetical protein